MNERARAILWVTAAFWGAHFVVFTGADVLQGRPHLLEIALMRAFLAGVGGLLCWAMHKGLRLLRGRSLRTRALIAALVAPIVAEGVAWVNYFGFEFVNSRSLTIPTAINWNAAIIVDAMWTWFFLAWASLMLALEYSFEVRDEKLRLAEQESLAHAAKLRALHSQINPHFLFNSLNSLSSLILDRKTEDADLMVTRLANFFRLSLASDPYTDIMVSQEFDLQLQYLEIERVRFPDLEVCTDIQENVKEARVPALILQPLVENAVKHGVSQSIPPTRIVLKAERENGTLQLSVKNFGRPGVKKEKKSGTGIGLEYVRERLESCFGGAQTLAMGPKGEDAFEASIRIPLDFGV